MAILRATQLMKCDIGGITKWIRVWSRIIRYRMRTTYVSQLQTFDFRGRGKASHKGTPALLNLLRVVH